MKRSLSSVFRFIVCGIETLGLGICAPLAGIHSVGPVRALEASACLENLIIQVNASPSNIEYGQSSLISWSISLPPECGYAHVLLNGNAVIPSGSQSVTPTQSTTYRVTVFLNLDGVSVQKTAFTRVTLTEVNQFCPNLPLLTSAEIWEPELPQQTNPRNQWLTETLNVASETILLGPTIILDFNNQSAEESYFLFGPAGTVLSVCASLPCIQDRILEDLRPETSDSAG